jgi:hypothetical protein
MLDRDDIIKMANDAGIKGPAPARAGFKMYASPQRLMAFAALVAAREREACAKVCSDLAMDRDVGSYGMLVAHSCANEILARGRDHG